MFQKVSWIIILVHWSYSKPKVEFRVLTVPFSRFSLHSLVEKLVHWYNFPLLYPLSSPISFWPLLLSTLFTPLPFFFFWDQLQEILDNGRFPLLILKPLTFEQHFKIQRLQWNSRVSYQCLLLYCCAQYATKYTFFLLGAVSWMYRSNPCSEIF